MLRAEREMGPPSVTVCIPTYNYAHYLGGAIASVLGQTYGDFELLVADDASTDDTAGVVRPFLEDRRVRFLPNQVNRGMFANFNRCVEAARGRYIKFLMADDWLAADFLAEMTALLDAHPELSFATSAGWLIDEQGVVFGEQRQRLGRGPVVAREQVVAEAARGFNVVGMPTSTLVRTAAMRAAGGWDSSYAPAADIALWFRLLAGSDLGWVARPLSYLRIHGSHTHSWDEGPDPAIFRVWEGARATPGSPVSDGLARRAARAASVQFTTFAVKSLLRGDLAAARRHLGPLRGAVGAPAATAAFLAALPRILRDRVVDTMTRRAGRAVVLEPYPRRGAPLAAVRASAEAGISAELRTALGRGGEDGE
jgi:hypothetical protein